MRGVPGTYFGQLQRLEKLHRRYFQKELAEYGFTPGEIVVLLFLCNNFPVYDTASDIVRLKGLSKGLVARSVNSLCKRGYLNELRDEDDRRIVHLRLNANSRFLAQRIGEKEKELMEKLERGISQGELEAVMGIMEKLQANVEKLLNEVTEHGRE